MFCNNCGSQLPDGTNFCKYCGTSQQQQPSASVEYPIGEMPPVAPPPPPPVTPQNYDNGGKPEKSNTNFIIIAVVAVILVVAVVVTAILLFGNKNGGSDDSTTTSSTTTQSETTLAAGGNSVSVPSSSTDATVPSSENSTLNATVPSVTIPSIAIPNLPTQAPTQSPTQAPTQAPTQKPTQAPTQAPTQKPTQPQTQPSASRPSLSSAESIASSYAYEVCSMNFSGIIPKEILSINKFYSEMDKCVINLTGASSKSEAYELLTQTFGLEINNASDFLDYLSDDEGYGSSLEETYGSNYRITTTVKNSRYLSASEAAPYISEAKSQLGRVNCSSSVSWSSIEDYALVEVRGKISGSKGQDDVSMTVVLGYINGSWKVICADDGTDYLVCGAVILESLAS